VANSDWSEPYTKTRSTPIGQNILFAIKLKNLNIQRQISFKVEIHLLLRKSSYLNEKI